MSTSSKPPTVFYSWQSDLPNKANRGLIRDALQKACKQLTTQLEEVIRVDSDTQGEPGSPDIAATILKKIEKASIVVSDVSIVGEATIFGKNGKKRLMPNPNVMLELGYAKKSSRTSTSNHGL